MTAPPPGFSRKLLTGLAQLLAAGGVGDWDPDGVYTSAQTALTIGGLPPSPDGAIALAMYGTGTSLDDPVNADTVVQVQARMRGGADPRLVDDLADGVYDQVHGLADTRLVTGVFVLLAQRRIVAPLGRDDSGRWERADSYELTVHWPTRHRD
ncbi:minor capsid protein [Nonomuraea sp. NPDC051191]|uniref:minor capsid protein n=1 Tax=Nonomuraea sp. NPDC051191 TaxID=3364372 RepID=UPI00379880A1